ncbi:hypothetical protein Forpi1262_v011139 [Fusarium oxysporum f. sp. raphani]|nr:hypothetical protein Forpi1262_v011139 [Fusarium oxysporum f. sp. raphani]KAK2692333.1 hypothetical protein QWA68_008220 [Fusarium oxysporum]
MVFHRDAIWSAMRQVAVFPGLWHDIKLGNWAKHLAAHIDEQIMTYWRHIYRVWNDVVFNSVDPSLRQCLDASSARFLQFMAPAWSKKDQEAIREKMKNGTLFCNISSEEDRSKLLRNILAFEGVIPSILTFHENMRYLTIGAKILERYIEVKRPTEKAKPALAPLKTPESLLSNLAQDWGQQLPVLDLVECTEGRYQSMHTPLQAPGAFMQLMLAALRSFPLLSSETPLQDIKGIGMNAFADAKSRSHLCKMASSIGFWNKKIEKGLALPDQDVPREIPDMIMFQTEQVWRGGLPTISVFSELRTKSFLPTLALAAKNAKGKEPSAALIQFDFVCAFFGQFDLNVDKSHAGLSIEELRNPVFGDSTFVSDDSDPMTDAPGLDVTTSMDWAEEGVSFTSEPLAATTKHRPSAKQSEPKTRRRKVIHDPLAKKPEKPKVKPKAQKRKEPKNIFGKTPMSSVPEDVDMTLDEPDVPEASQRISTPHVDGLDISQQGRPQQPHAEPHAEPPVEPHAEPQGIELEVPEPHRPVSPPIMDGYSMLQEQHKQREALELQQKQQQDALKLQQPQQQDALQLQQPRTQPQQEALKRKKEINKPGNDTTEIRKPDKDDEFPNKRKKVYDTHKKVYDTREKVDDTREPEIPQRPEACLEAPALEEEEEW